MGHYIPRAPGDRERMLEALGLDSPDELFRDIPEGLRLKSPLTLPGPMSELEMRRYMEDIAGKNIAFPVILRGAGAYHHYIPAAVRAITSNENFVTAYTPYQPEISQGILQSIFEFQTMMCRLTGLDISNASVYDGASAAAEAAAMCRDKKRSKVLVSAAAHPDTVETLRAYCSDCELIAVPETEGVTDKAKLSKLLDGDTACFYMQQPNFYGLIEDAEALGELVRGAGAKFIMGVNPIAMALCKSPAECGADIATGEGQPLGLPMSYGGPYLGFMTAKKELGRRLPGRIVGQTVDLRGSRAFVLTMQAREQHIRREKASSNICSNQALCAMTAAAYLSLMGPEGFTETARQCYSKAHYFADGLMKIGGFELCFPGEFFHEFVTSCPVGTDSLMAALEAEGILGGLPVKTSKGGGILWCVTEMCTKSALDRALRVIKEAAEK